MSLAGTSPPLCRRERKKSTALSVAAPASAATTAVTTYSPAAPFSLSSSRDRPCLVKESVEISPARETKKGSYLVRRCCCLRGAPRVGGVVLRGGRGLCEEEKYFLDWETLRGGSYRDGFRQGGSRGACDERPGVGGGRRRLGASVQAVVDVGVEQDHRAVAEHRPVGQECFHHRGGAVRVLRHLVQGVGVRVDEVEGSREEVPHGLGEGKIRWEARKLWKRGLTSK